MSKKILIIDDDVELSEELSEAIRDEGHWVESAFDSDRGCDLIRQMTMIFSCLILRCPA
jgi:DNA-binding response OmpR family regulator